MSLPDEVLMTVKDVAARVQLSRESVLDAIRRGELRARKFGNRGGWRIRQADYEAWLGAASNDPTVLKTAGEIDEANRVMRETDRKWKKNSLGLTEYRGKDRQRHERTQVDPGARQDAGEVADREGSAG